MIALASITSIHPIPIAMAYESNKEIVGQFHIKHESISLELLKVLDNVGDGTFWFMAKTFRQHKDKFINIFPLVSKSLSNKPNIYVDIEVNVSHLIKFNHTEVEMKKKKCFTLINEKYNNHQKNFTDVYIIEKTMAIGIYMETGTNLSYKLEEKVCITSAN